MHKFNKTLILGLLSVLTVKSIEIYSFSSTYGMNPNLSQNQISYDEENNDFQNTPDMSDERAFMIQSRNRMNELEQSNRNMIEQDRQMMREGYDVNESQ